ncbi:MAG: Re/Si-specific NAD(P)(+) transhydrogenase subunit alpha [Acidimicrobiia bacterium]
MIVGVNAEKGRDERRVALVPAVVAPLIDAGVSIVVETGAGIRAGFSDAEYEEQGARIANDSSEVLTSADVLVRVRGFEAQGKDLLEEVSQLGAGHTVVGLLNPFGAPSTVEALAERGVTAFALELLPRISRAQPMDALTSMATISGYKAVLEAAVTLNKMCPLLMSAAGTVTPARVFVIGAGVAGLQAIATARRLGAVVQAYDVRPAVGEQVESLGARFVQLELDTEQTESAGGYAQAMGDEFYSRQRELMTEVVAESDIVITTAAVPGATAPVLVTGEAVRRMRPGSVIVDLAAETGGNCEFTRPGETVDVGGVTILGPLNLASTIPFDASHMYARNIAAFLGIMHQDGVLHLDLDDQILRDSLVTHDGDVAHSKVRELLELPALESTQSRSTGS